MKINVWLTPVILLVTFLSSLGCALTAPGILSQKPPSAFQESDLVGAWVDDNDSETLVLQDDNTFSQSYENADASYQYEGEGAWLMEQNTSGCVYVHLKGMRYFHLVMETADNGNRY